MVLYEHVKMMQEAEIRNDLILKSCINSSNDDFHIIDFCIFDCIKIEVLLILLITSKQGQTNWNACHLEESLFFVMGHKIIIKELGFLSLSTLCYLQNELLISSESLLYDFCCYNLWCTHGLFLTINCQKFIVSFMKYISYT